MQISNKIKAGAVSVLFLCIGLFGCASTKDAKRSNYAAEMGITLDNFDKVTPDIWRSEQPSDSEFKQLKANGLRSVLNLREYHTDDDEAAGLDLVLYHVKIEAGSLSADELLRCLQIIRDAPKPILIHCMHGSDRTGAVCAAYRIVFQKQEIEVAIEEMTDGGFGFHNIIYANIPRLFRKTDFDAMKQAIFAPNTQ